MERQEFIKKFNEAKNDDDSYKWYVRTVGIDLLQNRSTLGFDLDKTVEELEELVFAIRDYRSSKDEDSRMHILEEMSDVMICIEVLYRDLDFSWEDIINAFHVKMERNLKRLMEDYKKEEKDND